MKVFIYGLHTLGGPLRYIGQTDNPARRLSRHRKEDSDTYKCRWVLKVGPSNVFMTILHKTTEENADSIEVALISLAKNRGFALCNTSEGGGGAGFGNKNNFGIKQSPEHRAKISSSMRGKKNRLGTRCSLETREKMSKARLGRLVSPETRRKISDAIRGIKRSEETRHKISQAKKGIVSHVWSEESKRKLSISLLGNKNGCRV